MNNETEAFDREWEARMKQQKRNAACKCKCQQTAKVNPSNREQAILQAGNELAEIVISYSKSEDDLKAVDRWMGATEC